MEYLLVAADSPMGGSVRSIRYVGLRRPTSRLLRRGCDGGNGIDASAPRQSPHVPGAILTLCDTISSGCSMSDLERLFQLAAEQRRRAVPSQESTGTADTPRISHVSLRSSPLTATLWTNLRKLCLFREEFKKTMSV